MSAMTQGGRKKVPADTLAARVLLVRHETGWSQREAAVRCGVPFGTWQGIELGRGTRDLMRHIAAIAEATGYDRDWLAWGGPLAEPIRSDGGVETSTSKGLSREYVLFPNSNKVTALPPPLTDRFSLLAAKKSA